MAVLMSSYYEHLFRRIPNDVVKYIGYGCSMGDKAYAQMVESEPRLFNSRYIYGLRSRLHDKAIQMYLEDRMSKNSAVTVSCMNTGYGNRVLLISGNGYSINPCHIAKEDTLPYPAKYKRKAAANNPGESDSQLNLLVPPVAKDYYSIYFILTTFFDGSSTRARLIIPDNKFSCILDSMPIFSVIQSEEEVIYQERKLPKLISEVEKEDEHQSR